MKLYAPSYYKSFKCIAEKCEHSCCIGWEIDIDGLTLEKYKSLSGGYGSEILKSIAFGETSCFKLCEGERCPHLNKDGLCKIILNVGEDYLCGICREHPRFYNYTSVAEVGLGMSCRESARVILSSGEFNSFIEVKEVEYEASELVFDGRAERERVFSLLSADGDYSQTLKTIYNDYNIPVYEDNEYIAVIEGLEYLDISHKDLFLSYSSLSRPSGMDEYLKRALAYFIYRHCTEAFDLEDFCLRLGFCLFCERLLASLVASSGANSLEEVAVLASIISEEIEYSEDNTASLTY